MSRTPSAETVPPRAGAAAGVRRRDVLGVPIALVDYARALDVIDAMVARRERGWICAAPAMSLVTAQNDPLLMAALRGATLTLPDGMPVVWAANLLGRRSGGERLDDRVYGPDLMRYHCQRAARNGQRVWLYGGHDDDALAALEASLLRDHPGLRIVGSWSPPHSAPTAAEDCEIAERIDADAPDVVWVGLGMPKQERWMARLRPLLEAPVLCGVGAAFDFHAGRVAQAPRWMQERGLEWAHRVVQQPRRQLPRYLRSNPRFVVGVARQYLRERRP
ncbi:MAG TPA: WecB/TagA/CpsF family glycosyltransferase [Thermoleophilaceae bacterium]|nr:WecB/TagA/CpsF family glycosyltransferase [Thermoleophilaceae bacterium]